MLTAGSLAQAKALVDQGVNADATFPEQTGFLAKSSDPLRNLHHRLFDNAVFNVRLSPATHYSIARSNADIPATSPPLLGLQTGLPYFRVPPNLFAPNTTNLPDGHHVLTAVAYEGSHVQTQTRITLPVRIQNTPLSASFTFVNFPDPSPVDASYQIQIVANTNNLSTSKLFGTEGLSETVTGEPSALLNVPGRSLGIGRHPFYAVVETSSGLQYRTETRWVRLVAGP